MRYIIRETESDAVCELLTPEGQSIATVEAEHAKLLAAVPKMRNALTKLMGRTWQITGKDPKTDEVLAYCREVLESTRG